MSKIHQHQHQNQQIDNQLAIVMKKMFSFFLVVAFTFLNYGHCAYNMNDSISYAHFAAITHCPGKEVQSWSCKICPNATTLTNVTYIENTKTQIVGFSGYDKNKRTIYFAFRCTIDITNYFEDVSFLLVPYMHCKECQVHLGFFDAFRSIENKILSALYKLKEYDPDAKVVVIGHSLGAAVATLTALQLQHKFGIVNQLHTFGGPRVGNQKLADFIKLKLPQTHRVIRYRDLAPHLPFEANAYRHPPFEIFFDEDMKNYTVCNDSGQDLHCSNKYFPEYSGKYHMWYFVQLQC